MDSVGIGYMPDAFKYGDLGSNTLGNISREYEFLKLPNLEKLGLGNISEINGVHAVEKPVACYGKMAEKSAGKDTTTGHWEIAGLILDEPFPVYPEGFPLDIVSEFEEAIGRRILGNIAASGTEIIKAFGGQHVRTGCPIVYTSADSVFQIAAHEDVIPVDMLYDMCRKAREILKGKHAVGRVIASPFKGEEGNYIRTERRRDFSLDPAGETILDRMKERGYEVKAVGKIYDIFNGRGITDFVHTHDNTDGVNKTIEFMKEKFEGLIFTNLVDFDMLYGHRNNVEGYAKALMDFDERIPEIIQYLMPEDILIITADHGCDPTTPSTDHSREYVPLLVYGQSIKNGRNLGIRQTFADIAASISEYFNVGHKSAGTSFLI